jgi:uncharacterized protein YgiM (DUF1202 family)
LQVRFVCCCLGEGNRSHGFSVAKSTHGGRKMRARLSSLALAVALGIGALPLVSAMAAIQTTPGSSNAAVSGSAVVAEAERFLGYPYSYTGDSPATGFSCIGFVWYVYHELGENIPGTNPTAYQAYTQVSESDLEPGDLVFFQGTFAGLFPSHVAIYIGGGKIIHAANPSYGVTISDIQNDPRDGEYWQEHYLSAERPWSGPSTGGGGGVIVRSHKVLLVNTSALDLHSGPSENYTVLTVLYQGARVTVEGWTPGWVRVADSAGTVGWVVRSGVARDLGISGVSSARHLIWRRAKTVYVYSLNVHTGPSLGDSVAFTLPEGSRVAVLSHSAGWAEVKTARGAAGWVVASYLGHHYRRTVTHRSSAVGHTPLRFGVNVRTVPSLRGGIIAGSNGQPVRVLHRSGGWAEVRLSTGTVGWVDGVFLGRRTGAVVRTLSRRAGGGRLVYPDVNIHSGPSVGYSIVGGTFSGMRVHVLGVREGFAHISTSTGIRGWIESRFLEGGARRSSGHRGYHAAVTVRLHNAAGIHAPVIGAVYVGQHVTILGSTDGWYYVRLRTGATGYVDAAYISP